MIVVMCAQCMMAITVLSYVSIMGCDETYFLWINIIAWY